MLEDNSMVFTFVDATIPLDDLRAIQQRLENSVSLIPGYVPPNAGFLSFESLAFAQRIEEKRLVILADRNLVSRMARTAREGVTRPADQTTQIAIDLMAYAQIVGLVIDPSAAFHELASQQGNAAANEELRWFRLADRAQAHAWIELAMGRASRLPRRRLGKKTNHDLERALYRWQRNYAALLKVAEFELGDLRPAHKMQRLIEWMQKDFIVAGPAMMFAAMYFSSQGRRGGMLKGLRSAVRERAIEGVRNATWDVTQLSFFVEKVRPPEDNHTRYIFATADEALATLAGRLFFAGSDSEDLQFCIASSITPWWQSESKTIAALMTKALVQASNSVPKQLPGGQEYVLAQVAAGEQAVRSWSPEC